MGIREAILNEPPVEEETSSIQDLPEPLKQAALLYLSGNLSPIDVSSLKLWTDLAGNELPRLCTDGVPYFELGQFTQSGASIRVEKRV